MDPKSSAGAVAAQQPYEIGRTSVDNTAKYLAGQKVPPFTFVPAVLINKENAAEKGKPFLDAAEKAGVK
jgi:ribose transport system substrate-binding protein